MTSQKPYHLMTPAERTAWRIARNRAIAGKIADARTQPPPTGSSVLGGTRATPEDRAALGSVIRKLRS
jgi:hypothetical protein